MQDLFCEVDEIKVGFADLRCFFTGSPRVWIGPSLGGARRRPNASGGWTCKVFCRALPSVGLSVTPIPGLPLGRVAQLQPALCHRTNLPVAQVGPTQTLGALWDSRRQLPLSGAAGTGFFPRICLNLWDSPLLERRNTSSTGENDLKSLKPIRRGPFNSPRRTRGSRPNFAHYGMPVILFEKSEASGPGDP